MALTLVVVPVHGHWEYALRTVKSLYWANESSQFDSSQETDCVVFDDASPDYSKEREQALLAVDRRVSFVRYKDRAGMTRSWNSGLNLARAGSYVYACLANSDLMFTPAWDEPLRDALKAHALVGPVSNAPGLTSRVQAVEPYDPEYKLSDDWPDLAATAGRLRASQRGVVIPAKVNGFCMMTRTDVAWKNAYDRHHVFDPGKPMAGNEDELQKRWAARGLTSAVVPASFVFHYRSVTRGDRYRKGRWMRMGQSAPAKKRSEL